MPVFKIIGGHGRVALLLAKELTKNPENSVISLFRLPEQRTAVEASGAEAKLFNVEEASVSQFAEALSGADFIIWAAGAGGKGGPQRTYNIDCDAAIRSMQASRQVVGLHRYVMVSYLGSSKAPQLSKDHPLYHYGQAKHQADEYLKNVVGLKYTIVSPGLLSNHEATGMIDVNEAAERHPQDQSLPHSISRQNVALMISTLLTDTTAFAHTLYKEIEALDGRTPILEALRSLE